MRSIRRRSPAHTGCDAAGRPFFNAEGGRRVEKATEEEVDETAGDEDPEEEVFFLWYLLPLSSIIFIYAAPALLLWQLNRHTVAVILLGLFALAVANGLAALYNGWRQRGVFLDRAGMLMKYGLSPFYLALFVAAMVSGNFEMGPAAFWGQTLVVNTWDVIAVVAALALLAGTSYVFATLETAVRQNRLPVFLAFLHGVAQFLPVVDILDLIWLTAVREEKHRILSLLALILLLVALSAALFAAVLFME